MDFSALQIVFILAVVCVKIYELSYFYCIEIPEIKAKEKMEERLLA